MVKYYQFVFYANWPRCLEAKEFIRTQMSLAEPNESEGNHNKNKLVWEDDAGIGRYRVDFIQSIPAIGFRYWHDRVTPEVDSADPMLEAILKMADFLPKGTKVSGITGKLKDIFELER